MEQSIQLVSCGHANSRLATRVLRVGKRLFGRVAAWRLERVRVWAQGKIAGLSARRAHPATFPVACAVGMGRMCSRGIHPVAQTAWRRCEQRLEVEPVRC